jgi:hypothetical protein
MTEAHRLEHSSHSLTPPHHRVKKRWFFAILSFGTSMLVQPLAVVELRLGLLSFYTDG